MATNALSAWVNAFLMFLQHRKITERERASINYRSNKTQKIFLLLAQWAIPLYSLRIIVILLLNARKSLELYRFESVQN